MDMKIPWHARMLFVEVYPIGGRSTVNLEILCYETFI